MGQKVHPYGFRLGYNKDWHSHWFAKKQYGDYLLEDLRLKRELKGRFAGAGVSHIDVADARTRKLILQLALQLQVFEEVLAELPLGIPVRVPVFVVAESKTVWMNFLTHNFLR